LPYSIDWAYGSFQEIRSSDSSGYDSSYVSLISTLRSFDSVPYKSIYNGNNTLGYPGFFCTFRRAEESQPKSQGIFPVVKPNSCMSCKVGT